MRTPEGQAIGSLAETLFGGAHVASNKALLELLDGPEIRARFVDALCTVIQRDGLTFAERNLVTRVTNKALDSLLRPENGTPDA